MICRLCGTKPKNKDYSRFFSKAGTAKQLCMKVAQVAGINILESDAFFDVMCTVCERTVERFYKFRCTVQQAQYNLQNMLQVKRVISPPPNPVAGKKSHNGKFIKSEYFVYIYN